MVSNAAVNPEAGPVLDSSEKAWDKIFDINVKCTFLLMKESLPLLKCSKSPSIIIVTSIAGYQPFNVRLIKDTLTSTLSVNIYQDINIIINLSVTGCIFN